jgi:hypothetical protein
MAKPKLSVFNPATNSAEPPRALGPVGRALWDRIQREFHVQDAGGCELLCLCGEALDRITRIRAEIDRDGEAIRDPKTGMVKANPLLRDELNGRIFVSRNLERLGVTLEPVKAMGRPAKW